MGLHCRAWGKDGQLRLWWSVPIGEHSNPGIALRSPALTLAWPDIGHLDERASRAVLGIRAQRGTQGVSSLCYGEGGGWRY